jgi:hypothetical protein
MIWKRNAGERRERRERDRKYEYETVVGNVR